MKMQIYKLHFGILLIIILLVNVNADNFILNEKEGNNVVIVLDKDYIFKEGKIISSKDFDKQINDQLNINSKEQLSQEKLTPIIDIISNKFKIPIILISMVIIIVIGMLIGLLMLKRKYKYETTKTLTQGKEKIPFNKRQGC